MSDNREQLNKNDSSVYDSLNTEDLKMLMDHAFYDEDTDLDTLKSMLDSYQKREAIDDEDAHAAWKDFLQNYSSQEETFPLPSNFADNSNQTNHSGEYRKPRRIIQLRRVGLIAATFIILFTVYLTATAHGSVVRQKIAHWGRDTFSFSDKTAPAQINEELVRLHEALLEHGITELLAPTRLPGGFVFYDLNVVELQMKKIFYSVYLYNEKTLIIQIHLLYDSNGNRYEKNEGDVELYIRNEITHYIMSNKDSLSIAWSYDDFECSIFGDISIGDAYLFINSIYER